MSGTPRGSKRMNIENKHRIDIENRRMKDKIVNM